MRARRADAMDEMPEPRLRAVLDRIAAGDERAVFELHKVYARRVHAFVLQRCRDDDVAQTVVSEVFFDVWKRPAAFRGDSRFSTWLLGVARHKMLSALRQRDGEHDDIDDLADELESGQPNGEQMLEEVQAAAVMHQCLDRLSALHRECLHLVYFEDHSLTELAQVQRVPEGTAKTRLFHARRKLRACVELSCA